MKARISQVAFLLSLLASQTATAAFRTIQDRTFEKTAVVGQIFIATRLTRVCVDMDYPGNEPTCRRYENQCDRVLQFPSLNSVGLKEAINLIPNSTWDNFFGYTRQPIQNDCQLPGNIWRQTRGGTLIKYTTREMISEEYAWLEKDDEGRPAPGCYRRLHFIGEIKFPNIGTTFRVILPNGGSFVRSVRVTRGPCYHSPHDPR